jgi:hypothetical protein
MCTNVLVTRVRNRVVLKRQYYSANIPLLLGQIVDQRVKCRSYSTKMISYLLLPTIYLLVLSILSRYHGGGISWLPQLGKVWKGLIYSLIVLSPLVIFINSYISILMFSVGVGLLALFKNTGHGNWFDLDHTVDTPEDKPERIEFLISWIKPLVSGYTYDTIGMVLKGGLMGLVTSLTVVAVAGGTATIDTRELFLLPAVETSTLLSQLSIGAIGGGLASVLGYSLGWYLHDNHGFKYPTELGEYLSGPLLGATVLLLIALNITLVAY